MGSGTPSFREMTVRAGMLTLAVAGLGVSFATLTSNAADTTSAQPTRADQDGLREQLVRDAFGLDAVTITELGLPQALEPAMAVDIDINGVTRRMNLTPHSVRSPIYEVRVQQADGTWIVAPPSPIRTVRGTIDGLPGATVVGSILDDGLHAVIQMGDDPINDEKIWVEPISHIVTRSEGLHAVYRNADVAPVPGGCGTSHANNVAGFAAAVQDNAIAFRANGAPGGGGNVCIAELACDTDVEYFNDYGSVQAVEDQINSIINTVNMQYESQVDLTHQITTILVRSSTDPYTSTDPEDRLCQFITEWTNNQTTIQRDVAHLFTGVDLAGSVIGIASDIGQTGICVNQGSCTGGQFGTQGSYCLSQSDFDNSFACKTDLTAHELGHLWGAFHCFCPSNTMNSGITCANNFSSATISSILAYKATRTCLSGNCDAGPAGACCFPDGSCSLLPGQSVCEGGGGTYEGDDTDCTPNPCPAPIVCGPGAGDCFSSNGTPGCEDEACCQLVCAGDPFCCDTSWDGLCADDALANCTIVSDGACCLTDGTCVVDTAAACAALGGDYQGDDTSCVPGLCPQPPAPCPWDCVPPGGNGVVNIDDLLQTINEFGQPGGGACDVAPDNGDGTFGNGVINVDDVLAIINNTGPCP